MNYYSYCNLMWELVNVAIRDAEYQVGVTLSLSDRQHARYIVLWRLIHISRLPVDLASHPNLALDFEIAPIPDEQEIKRAIKRLRKRLPAYHKYLPQQEVKPKAQVKLVRQVLDLPR